MFSFLLPVEQLVITKDTLSGVDPISKLDVPVDDALELHLFAFANEFRGADVEPVGPDQLARLVAEHLTTL